MDTKLLLFLLFVCLVLMLLFNYFDKECNIVIILGVTIILLVNDLIENKEYFNVSQTNTSLDSLINQTNFQIKMLSQLKENEDKILEQDNDENAIEVKSSCPPDLTDIYKQVSDQSQSDLSASLMPLPNMLYGDQSNIILDGRVALGLV